MLDLGVELEVRITRFTLTGFARNLKDRVYGAPDGLSIPSPHLLYTVMGSVDVHAFLESGKVHANELILGTLNKNGFKMTDFEAVLDFGCGCGRIMRYWASMGGPSLHGTDYNPRLIRWCERNLPFGQYRVNGVRPPLEYDSEKFDLIYARSVFTHLPETLQREWLGELGRVLKVGGLLLFTVSGQAYYSWMSEDEQRQYDANRMVVRERDQAGKNLCAVFHPEEWVRSLVDHSGYTIVDMIPGRTVEYFYQDTWLVQKRS